MATSKEIGMSTGDMAWGGTIVFIGLLFVHPYLSIAWFVLCMCMAVADVFKDSARADRADEANKAIIKQRKK